MWYRMLNGEQMYSLRKRIKFHIRPWKSKGYLAWLKIKFPGYDLHHCLNSFTGFKVSDSLMVPLSREQHSQVHENNQDEFFEDNLYIALNNLQGYITYLEDTIESFQTSKEGSTINDNTKEDN